MGIFWKTSSRVSKLFSYPHSTANMNRPKFLAEVVVLEHVLKISDDVLVTAKDQRHAREPWPKCAVAHVYVVRNCVYNLRYTPEVNDVNMRRASHRADDLGEVESL